MKEDQTAAEEARHGTCEGKHEKRKGLKVTKCFRVSRSKQDPEDVVHKEYHEACRQKNPGSRTIKG
jgi:hypothetical protein